VIEPEASAIANPQPEDLLLSPHELDPARVLRLATALGGQCRRVVLDACEPASFGDDEWGAMELTQPVAAAIDIAADLVEQVVHQLLAEESSPWIPATQATRNEAAPSSPTEPLSATGE
jgi:hydrogenase maturation protease